MVPLTYFGRERRLASIMIEVNRRLYMDESAGRKSQLYFETKASLSQSLTEIAGYWRANGNA
jgi:hypothetical protein